MRELKTTDIEWLGDIPVNWDIHSLKRVLSNPITDGPHETPILYDEGIPFVSAESVKGGVINLNYKRGYISLEDHERFQRKVFLIFLEYRWSKDGHMEHSKILV